ncbi:MAG TPA: class I SAM-dependent methyltransferase [Nocardioides sp.]|uniref:class I SAM-dependent methyltransferase n=1 Tax=uncultured Nocardioides sp. TaxID=198441 RepID=UPI0026034D34|nr:class I SAM-dependent methyltransferase [uncultured Nocardioides sp.]HRD60547.1 class I SAM-dependent methyltransferase [Nocardioides sp.]HRI97944.1 class I SAM-dependent methyltransferase [Nocardioides sp.]HRK44636.1 class I SAM-dependent methyltransferase [Nocardioides sp.]
MTHERGWNELADELGIAAVADGEPTRWYDELWSAARQGDVALPWDHTDPHPVLRDWLGEWSAEHGDGSGRRAVVVGCGLGADSEHLAARGWRTVAFDISPAAVTAVRDRYPDSAVDYREGDLLDLATDLVGAFDLVVEIYTLQALHPSLRDRASSGVRRLLAPGGTALVVQVVRRDDEPVTEEPPWTLSRAEMEAVAGDGVRVESLDEVEVPGRAAPFWRLLLTRP